MGTLFAIEIEPEVKRWLAGLSDRDFGRVDFLTVFSKTRSAEISEIRRALEAQKTCQAEHGPAHETFDREVHK